MNIYNFVYLFQSYIHHPTGYTYDETCEIYDEKWGQKKFQYHIPEDSFCSNVCTEPNKGPVRFECPNKTEEIRDWMPLITFYWHDDNCEVRTGEGKNDIKNQGCIEAVAKYLSTATGSHKTRLVYIIHGWIAYFGKQEKDWQIEMKDSFLKRYENEHIVVGVVSWKRAARLWPNEKNNNTKIIEKFSQAMSNENKPPKLSGDWKKLLCCTFRKATYLNAASNAWPIGNIIGYVNK